MITALIRTHPGRGELTKRAILSATSNGCKYIVYNGEKVNDYSYNLYCNELKAQVTEGHFFFLDSDDFIIPGSLKKIEPYLENKAIVCQMLRNGFAKPRIGQVVRGQIGLPCLILHHSLKFIANVTDNEYGDYDYIKAVTKKVPWIFLKIPLVNAGSRSHGK